jgi:hypothetical protein
MKPGSTVAWLSARQAAVHLGFVKPDGTLQMKAFYFWLETAKPRRHWLGGRLRFRVADLDACVEAEASSPAIRLVEGAR